MHSTSFASLQRQLLPGMRLGFVNTTVGKSMSTEDAASVIMACRKWGVLLDGEDFGQQNLPPPPLKAIDRPRRGGATSIYTACEQQKMDLEEAETAKEMAAAVASAHEEAPSAECSNMSICGSSDSGRSDTPHSLELIPPSLQYSSRELLPPSLRVLLLEDIESQRAIMMRQLQECSASMTVHTTHILACAGPPRSSSSTEAFDVAFVDMSPPPCCLLGEDRIDGAALVGILRASWSSAAVIIGLSSSSRDVAKAFFDAGADAVWQKPFPPRIVLCFRLGVLLEARKKLEIAGAEQVGMEVKTTEERW